MSSCCLCLRLLILRFSKTCNSSISAPSKFAFGSSSLFFLSTSVFNFYILANPRSLKRAGCLLLGGCAYYVLYGNSYAIGHSLHYLKPGSNEFQHIGGCMGLHKAEHDAGPLEYRLTTDYGSAFHKPPQNYLPSERKKDQMTIFHV